MKPKDSDPDVDEFMEKFKADFPPPEDALAYVYAPMYTDRAADIRMAIAEVLLVILVALLVIRRIRRRS